MNADNIRKLLEKYYDGNTSIEEEEHLRRYFSQPNIAPDLKAEAELFRFYSTKGTEKAPDDGEWREALDEHQPAAVLWLRSPVFRNIARVAAVVIFMLIGFAAGILYSRGTMITQTNGPATVASAAGFEKIPSASERIKLISQVSDRVEDSNYVIASLIQSLNNDDNVNVRLAAAQALYKYTDNPSVRQALVRSLQNQEDPNVQVTLIDMLVKLHERRAVHEMQVMLLRRELNPVVRYKLMAGIGALM